MDPAGMEKTNVSIVTKDHRAFNKPPHLGNGSGKLFIKDCELATHINNDTCYKNQHTAIVVLPLLLILILV